MSLGELGLLPPELLRAVCGSLPLEDIICLQHSHPILNALLHNLIFRHFRLLEVDWNSKGATLSLSGASSAVYSITTESPFWRDVLRSTDHISRLVITKTEDAKNYAVLDAITKRGYNICELEVRLRPGSRLVSKHTIGLSYARLTSFVSIHRHGLSKFRLDTDPQNYVMFDGGSSLFHYHHEYSTTICNQLITPLFHTLLRGRTGMTSVTLRIECKTKPELILQSAFQAALPFEHRTQLQVLRLEFGSTISLLSQLEIQQVLSSYAPYLNGTRNLQHLICDLSQSTLDPCSLEKLYSIISHELCNDQHRISLLTAPPSSDPHRDNMKRVSCK